MKDTFSARFKKIFTRKQQQKSVPRSFQMRDEDFFVENWTPPYYESKGSDAYQRAINSYWTQACIEKYKSAMSLVRPVCQKWDQKAENWVRVPNHPIERLIDSPNEYQPTAEFFSVIIENLWLNGNALISIKDTRSSGSVRLEALNTDLVKMSLSEKEGKLIEGYDVYKEGWGEGAGSKKKFVPRSNMIHIRLANSQKLEWGISPLEAIKNVQETEADAVEYNRSYMRNTGRPPFALVSEEPLNRNIRREIQRAIAEETSGRYSGMPLVLGYGIKPVSLGKTPVELDYIKADRLNGERISAIFQVPSPLINITENATLANVKEFVKLMWTAGVVPKLYVIFQAMSKYWVHPRFGDEYRLWFDLTAIPELMDHTMRKAELMEKFIEYGWTPNELNVFLELGLPYNPIGGIRRYNGEVIDWAGVEPPEPEEPEMVSSSDAEAYAAAKARRRKAKAEGTSGYTREELDRIWVSTEFSRKTLEDIFRVRVEEQMVKDLNGLTQLPVSSINPTSSVLEDWAVESRRQWKNTLDRVWSDSTKYFMDSFQERYASDRKSAYLKGYKADLTPQDHRVISKIVEQKAKFVVDTTTHFIIDFVNDYLNRGFTEEEIVVKLQEEIPELSKFRAQVIVENEVVAAGNYGNALAAEKSGTFTEKVWHTRRDNRVRPTHVTMEGEKRLLSQKYSNQLRYPGDPDGPAKEIINCRCFESYA